MFDTTKLLAHDTDCTDCGETAVLLTCEECAAKAVITNCGHYAQPRPIVSDGIAITCLDCYDKQVQMEWR